MQASIIIPVWNGESIIADCLAAVFTQSGDRLLEVICVDNASPDQSAAIITRQFPQVRLISLPVNLGFAGGVNAGLRAARGEVDVLLNQDCLVQAGWLDALLDALHAHPEFGIAGCTLYNADGSINHAGAHIDRSLALGQHLTDLGGDEPRVVDYVTGAAMAIRRTTWDTIGPLDDGFYPAYYEEVDYCYRARRHGLEIGYVPTATVRHLFTSREWQHDPVKHWATQRHSRYRFVCKHFTAAELATFFECEAAAIEADSSFEMNAARALGSRDTLRELHSIVRQRLIDLGDTLTADHVRHLRVGLAQIARQAFAACERLARADGYMSPRWLNAALLQTGTAEQQAVNDQLRSIEQREQAILVQAFFTADSSWLTRTGKRLVSLVTGREHRLLTELNVLHTQRLTVLEHWLHVRNDTIAQQLERRLALLETLMDYDYR